MGEDLVLSLETEVLGDEGVGICQVGWLGFVGVLDGSVQGEFVVVAGWELVGLIVGGEFLFFEV